MTNPFPNKEEPVYASEVQQDQEFVANDTLPDFSDDMEVAPPVQRINEKIRYKLWQDMTWHQPAPIGSIRPQG